MASNMTNVRKHCWELKDSTFTTYINPCEGKSVLKSVSEWYKKTSEMFVNPLSVDNKYPVPNRCSIMQHIQVQLSQKRKIFCEFFFTFPKFRLYFKHFQKKDDFHNWYGVRNTWLDQCLKGPVSENHSTSNLVN